MFVSSNYILVHIILIQNLLEGICNSLEQKLADVIHLDESNDMMNITQDQQIMLSRSILTSLGQIKFRHGAWI